MKHLFAAVLAVFSTNLVFANSGTIPERPLVTLPNYGVQPANPMENYTPTTVSSHRLSTLWNTMNDKMDGKDCYRRAQVWTYDMYDFYGVKSMKIFIHYTNKFNRELDEVADMSKRGIKDKLDYRIYKMLGYNKTWDYHVAPLVLLDNGEYRVLDKELILAYDAGFPYTDNEAWNLTKRPAKIEEWLDGLTIRGELLWKARKLMLERDMAKARSRDRMQEYNNLRAKYVELGMDKNDQIDIKCHKAESIAEVDLNHATKYCFYTIAPMYYYNEIDLRSLAFGNTNQSYSMPVRADTYTEENYLEGARNYVQDRWNYSELKDAKKEIKWGGGNDCSDRIKKEQ